MGARDLCFQDAKQVQKIADFGENTDAAESKLLTVVYANELVNPNFLNFVAQNEAIAKVCPTKAPPPP